MRHPHVCGSIWAPCLRVARLQGCAVQVAFDKVGSMPMARIRGFREENQEVSCFLALRQNPSCCFRSALPSSGLLALRLVSQAICANADAWLQAQTEARFSAISSIAPALTSASSSSCTLHRNLGCPSVLHPSFIHP